MAHQTDYFRKKEQGILKNCTLLDIHIFLQFFRGKLSQNYLSSVIRYLYFATKQRCLGLEHNTQGFARDVKARDRDETETLASPAKTRPRRDVKISRRDVCSSRDVIETLKYKFYRL